MVPAQYMQDQHMDLDHPQEEYQEHQSELAPEPEGKRMTKLRGLLDKALYETLRTCNFDAIQECFPSLAAANPEELRVAHEKVCTFLDVEVHNEFEQIINERSIIFKLNALDRLIEDAEQKGRTAGSSTILNLSPDVAVRARTVPTKEAEIERLKAELERVQLDNRRLGNALNHSKAEQAAIKIDLLESYNEFQEGSKNASSIPIHEMEQLLDAAMLHVQDL
ncbi:kinetochore protein NNF1 [Entomortierella parvispora]|uniref:Kinetochore protein NNF1 n=1 Tax=Entomortierella parvispora TaxID=205924 RepID=A0A9P3H1U1_9FUNG|nr:kinetochore protein NNF1 [Entomortierella parvispora]